MTPSSALPQSNRANQSSKASGETPSKPSPPSHISKEHAHNKPETEKLRRDWMMKYWISSGSETDRENDESNDNKVVSHFSGSSLNPLAFYFFACFLNFINGE